MRRQLRVYPDEAVTNRSLTEALAQLGQPLSPRFNPKSALVSRSLRLDLLQDQLICFDPSPEVSEAMLYVKGRGIVSGREAGAEPASLQKSILAKGFVEIQQSPLLAKYGVRTVNLQVSVYGHPRVEGTCIS